MSNATNTPGPEAVTFTRDLGDVSGLVDRPSRASGPGLALTHGAGGGIESVGLAALAAGLSDAGTLVARFNLAYREAGRGSPPRADRSVPDYAASFAAIRNDLGPRRAWAAGGKSYGGRVASMAVADGMPAAALVFYGYPLHPPGKPEALRVEHWPRIGVPCLFLQGTGDGFCDLDLLHANTHLLPVTPTVHVVAGGDHSLRVGRKGAPDGVARSEAKVLAGLAPVVREWLGSL